jgi:hypothetical protein
MSVTELEYISNYDTTIFCRTSLYQAFGFLAFSDDIASSLVFKIWRRAWYLTTFASERSTSSAASCHTPHFVFYSATSAALALSL